MEVRAWPAPKKLTLSGRFCVVEPLSITQHLDDLHAAFSVDKEGEMWRYMGYGPFRTKADLEKQLALFEASKDPLFFAIRLRSTGKAVGIASYLRLDPANGVVEVGHLSFSPLLQRTPASTESMFLMMRHAMEDLKYRRYEWKCNARNAKSISAALRLGFTFEGVFRQAGFVKGANRDTAWFSITDTEYPKLREKFEGWLSPANFDPSTGKQRSRL